MSRRRESAPGDVGQSEYLAVLRSWRSQHRGGRLEDIVGPSMVKDKRYPHGLCQAMHVYVCCCLVGLGQAITPMACVRPCTHVVCGCCVCRGSAIPSMPGASARHADRLSPRRELPLASSGTEPGPVRHLARQDDAGDDVLRVGRTGDYVARAKSGATCVRGLWPVSGSCMYLILDILQSYYFCIAVSVCSGQGQRALLLQVHKPHHRVLGTDQVHESRRRSKRAWAAPSSQTANLNTQTCMSQRCLLFPVPDVFL